MGIKGIYGEIGGGERIALSKIAMEYFEQTGRPLRIAVDISIWQFQVQSGKGGSNPALRTLYYRLLRLLSLAIEPLFIFDGLNKPPFKRNVRTGPHVASLPNLLTKQMLKLFGFPFLTAPGEAEAECALLQREGVVEAVLSEDVDTLMFGCTMSLRNWSSEGTRGNKSPTHVSVYRSRNIKEGKASLDREGMVLIALMSGGDYIPAGIPGCGIKIACEAARAGFGNDLCQLSRKDTIGLNQWRERLQYELRTNESGFFRVKHRALQVPETFPDKAVLGYYTHPSVSSAEKVQSLKTEIVWNSDVDIKGLRAFVGDAFEWHHLSGAKKFIRGIAPALLVYKLWKRSKTEGTKSLNLEPKAEKELQHIKAICGRRAHISTDGCLELRVAYIPAEIVDIDLDQEESDIYAGVIGTDSNVEDPVLDRDDQNQSRSPTKRSPSMYDPSQPEKIWILETFVKVGMPLMLSAWEQDMKDPKKFASRERATLTEGKTKKEAALDASMAVTKPRTNRVRINASSPLNERKEIIASSQAPPGFQSCVAYIQRHDVEELDRTTRPSMQTKDTLNTPTKKKSRTKPNPQPNSPVIHNLPKGTSINPWNLSQQPSHTFDVRLDDSERHSTLDIHGSPSSKITSNLSPINVNLENSRPTGSSLPPGMRSKDAKSSLLFTMEFDHEKDSSVRNQLEEGSIVQKSQSFPKRTKKIEIISVESSPESSPKTPSLYTSSSRVNCIDSVVEGSPRQPLSSSTDNRALKFGKPASIKRTSSTSSPTSLETIRSMMQELSLKGPAVNDVKIDVTHRPVEVMRSRRFAALRESLEGAWKEMDYWELQVKNPRFAYEGVEVLDLTRT